MDTGLGIRGWTGDRSSTEVIGRMKCCIKIRVVSSVGNREQAMKTYGMWIRGVK